MVVKFESCYYYYYYYYNMSKSKFGMIVYLLYLQQNYYSFQLHLRITGDKYSTSKLYLCAVLEKMCLDTWFITFWLTLPLFWNGSWWTGCRVMTAGSLMWLFKAPPSVAPWRSVRATAALIGQITTTKWNQLLLCNIWRHLMVQSRHYHGTIELHFSSQVHLLFYLSINVYLYSPLQ